MPDILDNDTGEATITGSAADDWITPPTGDFLATLYFEWGSDDNDLIFTDAGNDQVWLTPGTDTIDGGTGYDALRVAQSQTITLTAETADEFEQFRDLYVRFRVTGFTVDTAAGTYELRTALEVPQPVPPATITF